MHEKVIIFICLDSDAAEIVLLFSDELEEAFFTASLSRQRAL